MKGMGHMLSSGMTVIFRLSLIDHDGTLHSFFPFFFFFFTRCDAAVCNLGGHTAGLELYGWGELLC